MQVTRATREVQAAEAGLRFGGSIEGVTGAWTVSPACEGVDEGLFYCVDHWVSLDPRNDPHLQTEGPHTIVWVCEEHGPETPRQLP